MIVLLGSAGWQSDWVDILQSNFMRHAFIGGTLVAVASGALGYFVVIRRDAFAAHALAHIGFPGATAAVLIGVPVTVGLSVFCVAGALAIGALGKEAAKREIATGSVLAAATALGVLFSSLATNNANTITNVLFGNLLAISVGQIRVFTVFTICMLTALAFIGRPLAFASLDAEVAEAKGVPVKALGVIFVVLLALVVTMAVQVVGTLLLFAMVVTPSATAVAITARPHVAIALSTAISTACVWIGLTLSAMFNLPPSFFIVSLAFSVWLITILVLRTPRARSANAASLRPNRRANPVP